MLWFSVCQSWKEGAQVNRQFLRCINYFKMPEYGSPFYCIPEQSSCIHRKPASSGTPCNSYHAQRHHK